jgi:hypothetical protein
MSRGSGRMKCLPVLDLVGANSIVLTVGRPEYIDLQSKDWPTTRRRQP